ncbi:type IIL restriction-modification enzyme MmeI [uncultured Eubacterium sp.]|uniref:type IIL restriction-modification enzyme MmeI n=1 Tax=uncultured Eubacterium sp. TaxID=165185 RepID=UPI00280433F9|nr:type IIL restriction-modification enzyme MmeI [uncultured Eubacterium sp.]
MSIKLNEQERRKAAKAFAEYWKDKGYEKGESQKFWLELLGTVYGVENASHYIEFEDQVHLDHTSFIDGYIPETKVLIEQKGLGKDLRKAIKQSDGSLLTPFEQAKRYSAELPFSRRPRWIITCNFSEFLVYDMENPNSEPQQILLKNLDKEFYLLDILVDTGNENIKREMEISIKAGEIVGRLYDALRQQYLNPDDESSLKSLNVLCVRLVFCFYAEDAGVFGKHLMFHDYLKEFDARHLRSALIDLFKILNTKIEDRDPYIDEELAQFPYVNGGLFAEENIEIPQFTDEIRDLILQNASEDFDWSEISPTIFGALFESTLNPETRRSGGMHYTSIENIHKVIDPLFLDDLKSELEEIKQLKQPNVQKDRLGKFCDKLSTLKFLDPACGSGNFLTETYISLRKLENEALAIINQDQIVFDSGDIIRLKSVSFTVLR